MVSLPPGPGVRSFLNLTTSPLPDPNTTALVATVADEHGQVVSEHLVQLVKPADLQVLPGPDTVGCWALHMAFEHGQCMYQAARWQAVLVPFSGAQVPPFCCGGCLGQQRWYYQHHCYF